MKVLKLEHEIAEQVKAGAKTTTWRINDDKNISVDDTIELIDKVDPHIVDTWQKIGVAKVNKVVQKRLGEVSDEDYEGHATYPDLETMYKEFGHYHQTEVGPETLVKIVHFSFTPYSEPTSVETPTQPKHYDKIKVYGDGGSRGNPGPSASGYVLLDMDDNIIFKAGVYLGITTNNQAEYHSLRCGLEEALKMQVREVDVYMDSLLVINQMKGIFKVRNRDLWPIHQAIKELIPKFKHVTFTHVPRELNKLADAEVNTTLDAEAAR